MPVIKSLMEWTFGRYKHHKIKPYNYTLRTPSELDADIGSGRGRYVSLSEWRSAETPVNGQLI